MLRTLLQQCFLSQKLSKEQQSRQKEGNQIKSKVATIQNMKPQLNQSQFVSKHLLFNILAKLERHYNLKIDKCQLPVSHRKYSKGYLRINSFENQHLIACAPEENISK
ncbi:hypothetical protein ABPG72_003270 [Tetrahymena utriculariae]